MISIGFCAMISSIISSCTSALVNYVSEQEKRNFYSGYVCCGIFAAGLRLFTKGSTKSESKVDSAAYFGIASCLYIIPIILFIVKLKIESVFNTFNRFVQGTPLSTSFLETFKLILIDFILTLVNSAITYSLFPGYLTKISTFPNIGNWIYVIITVLFCIFLFCGNQTANHFLFRRKPLRFLSLLRLSFYPLFIISIQNIIKFDPYWTVFWVIPFAFSDTYFENNIIYLAINENERLTVDKKSIANDILFLAKNCGAVVGVLLTFVLDLLG